LAKLLRTPLGILAAKLQHLQHELPFDPKGTLMRPAAVLFETTEALFTVALDPLVAALAADAVGSAHLRVIGAGLQQGQD
jgi:hypothetical protein